MVYLIVCLVFYLCDSEGIFLRQFKAPFLTFPFRRWKWRSGSRGTTGGHVWISASTPTRAPHVHRTTFVRALRHSPSCCQLALVMGRADDTGLSRTYVPTTPWRGPQAPRQPPYKAALLAACSECEQWHAEGSLDKTQIWCLQFSRGNGSVVIIPEPWLQQQNWVPSQTRKKHQAVVTRTDVGSSVATLHRRFWLDVHLC